MANSHREQVQKLLREYHPALKAIVAGAWEKWRSVEVDLGPVSARTRACLIWDAMIARALDVFDNDSRVVVVSQSQTYYFLIQDQVVLRFKKGDEAGLSRNFPTQTALNFHDPNGDMFGAPHKVEVVYVLDRTQSRLSQILVVARNGSQIEWVYELESTSTADVITLPSSSNEAPEDRRRIVRLKASSRKQARNDTRDE